MKELSIEQMENTRGGAGIGCAAGIIAMGAIAGFALTNPVVFGATFLYGPGSGLLASVTSQAALLIVADC
jgi:hypothetical protein